MALFQLCASNIGWAAEDDEAVWELLARLGFTGLEIAPTRVLPQDPYDRLQEGSAFADRMRQQYGLTIASMQSIWYGRNGSLFVPHEAEQLEAYTEKAFAFAAACGCPNLVFGCPRQRNVPEGHKAEELDGFFTRMDRAARAAGVKLAVEANPPIYNTNFGNTTPQAMALVKRLGSGGLSVNLDMGTVIENNENLTDLAPMMDRVSHVHISRPGLAAVKPHPADEKLAALLKQTDYRGFVSLEMKTSDIATVENSLRYMKEVLA